MQSENFFIVKLPAISMRILLTGVAVAVLTACGGTGQDDGQVSTTQQQLSGLAIDGNVVRATVFIDSNNNATRDAWESYAFTDNNGYYSYNPLTQTDYCDSNATEQQQQYCLWASGSLLNTVIRVDGGYDLLTGEAFLGQMSRRISSTDGVIDSIISPLTSLLTYSESDEDKNSILGSLGLTDADLDINYLDTDGSGGIDANLLNTALTVHKVVTVLADRLTDTYTEIGNTYGTPNDASAEVYASLATSLEGDQLLEAVLQESSLLQVLDVAESELREVYEFRDLTLPTDMGNLTQPGAFSRAVEIASDIKPVVDSLINPEGTETTAADVAGKARALESLVLKAVSENDDTDASIANAVGFFTDTSNEPLIGALVDSLSATTADLGSLAKNDFSGTDFDSVLEIAQSSSVPEGALPFSGIGGTTLRLSDSNLGVAPDALNDSEIEFYFGGAADDVEGSFSACIKVITNASSDGTLGVSNTRGESASGYWSMLSAENGASYSVLMTVDFLGTTYQSIIKAAGTVLIDGVSHQSIGFDFEGQLRTWQSMGGFTPGSSAATSNAECEARLPSRIGL